MNINNYLYFYTIYIILLSTIISSSCIINNNITLEVEEGIYNIILKKRFSILTYLYGLRTSREKYGHSRLNFKLMHTNNNKNKFFIQHIYTGLYIGIEQNKNENITEIQIIAKEESYFDNKNKNTYIEYFEWEFLKEKNMENNFYIKNSKINCYLKEVKYIFICSRLKDDIGIFSLLKIYQEINKKEISEEDKKILEKEPIDVVIKYIDLNDPKLIRNNLTQITKDIENEELKYCIRSILTNIPWIRKIFILMPNDKVRFLKDYSDINNKIIYVKDKDILGHESSNVHAFQYRLWKLAEYGLSRNFISMDDDYFIGKPMKKSDFFYVEKNNVFPCIISTNYQIETYDTTIKECEEYLNRIELINTRTQTSDEFMYTVYRTYLFFIKYFDSPIVVPGFTHNAIPVNINDLKEIFNIVDNSIEFRYYTLYCLYRNKFSLQYQTTILVYTINKYNRKVNKIKYNYIDSANTINGNYNYPLFCINTGNNKDYSEYSFMQMKVVLEKLFPIPTKYEIYDVQKLADNSFNVIKTMEGEINTLIKEKEEDVIENQKYNLDKINRIYDKYMNQIQFFKIENYAYDIKIKKYKTQIKECINELDNKEKKVNKLKLKHYKNMELNDIKKENKDIELTINKYKGENEDYNNKINYIENNVKRVKLLIYIQSIVIIIIICVIIFLYKRKRKNNNNSIYLGYRNLIT